MAKIKKDEIFALVDEKLKECKEEMQIEAELTVCKFILSLIRDITNEVKTLDDLDTFICAMIENRERHRQGTEEILLIGMNKKARGEE